MISRSVVPMGTSTNPVFTTLPVRAKVLVPALDSVPMPLYHCAPWLTIPGTLANVSTLFSTVGLPHSP